MLEIYDILESFRYRILNDQTLHEISHLSVNMVDKFLYENDGLYLKENISYNISILNNSISIVPNNFFTGLIFNNIFHPPALYTNIYDSEFVTYSWNNGRFCFRPKSNGEVRDWRIDKILKKDELH